jgi:hypothetical protein
MVVPGAALPCDPWRQGSAWRGRATDLLEPVGLSGAGRGVLRSPPRWAWLDSVLTLAVPGGARPALGPRRGGVRHPISTDHRGRSPLYCPEPRSRAAPGGVVLALGRARAAGARRRSGAALQARDDQGRTGRGLGLRAAGPGGERAGSTLGLGGLVRGPLRDRREPTGGAAGDPSAAGGLEIAMEFGRGRT